MVVKYLQTFVSLTLSWGLQIATFFITARALGPAVMGVYAALYAPIAIAIEIVGLGAGDRLIRAVARDRRSFGKMWGHAIAALVLSVPPLVVIYVITVSLNKELQIYVAPAAVLASCELFFTRISLWAEHCCIAHDDYRRANWARICPSVMRLCGLLTSIYLFDLTTVEGFIYANSVISTCTGVLLYILVRNIYGKAFFKIRKEELIPGGYFALNQATRAAQSNVDRFALAFVASAETVAFYSIATRLLQFGLFPITAVLRIAYPAFFRRGSEGFSEAFKFACFLALPVGIIAVSAAFGLYYLSNYIVYLVGNDYAGSVEFIKVFIWVIIPISLSYLSGDALAGAERQGLRSVIFISSSILQLCALILLVPKYNVYGAIYAMYISSSVYCIASWGTAAYLNAVHSNRR